MEKLHSLLKTIVASPVLHARWLNTLSYMENCGARKIAACEHPTLVREEMLKHAAEEFRHAHHLKKQIKRVTLACFPDYCLSSLLGGFATLHYLNRLDTQTSRVAPKPLAYLLVTYAIELRAEKLYPIYDHVLRETGSKVAVKCILLEEKDHLDEMKRGLQASPSGLSRAEEILQIEETLFQNWLRHIGDDLENNDTAAFSQPLAPIPGCRHQGYQDCA